jgi:hypothetical protein
VCIMAWDEIIGYQNPAGRGCGDPDDNYDEIHFGSARCLVWSILSEAGLVIAMLLCGLLWLCLLTYLRLHGRTEYSR